jgi:hypothetical protein
MKILKKKNRSIVKISITCVELNFVVFIIELTEVLYFIEYEITQSVRSPNARKHL